MNILVPLDGSPEAEGILPLIVPLAQARFGELELLEVVAAPGDLPAAESYLAERRARLLREGVPCAARATAGEPVDEILSRTRSAGHELIAMTLRRSTPFSIATAVLRQSTVPLLIAPAGTRAGDWRSVVVALDGFAGAEEALQSVAPLARAFGSILHLLHVTLPLLPFDDRKGTVPVPQERADEYLEDVCKRLAAQGIQAVQERREGAPGPAICRAADQTGAGLICLASALFGAGPAARTEGVTEFVLRNAPCPVWICSKRSTVDPRGSTRRLLKV